MSSWGVSVPSETFTKVMFSCLWWGLQLLSGTGGLGLGAEPKGPGLLLLGGPRPKEVKYGLWGFLHP